MFFMSPSPQIWPIETLDPLRDILPSVSRPPKTRAEAEAAFLAFAKKLGPLPTSIMAGSPLVRRGSRKRAALPEKVVTTDGSSLVESLIADRRRSWR